MAQPATTRTGKHALGSERSFEQMLEDIRNLDAAERSRVAQVLAESEMDARFKDLIVKLADKQPVDEISDFEIQAEVDAVRRAHLRTPW